MNVNDVYKVIVLLMNAGKKPSVRNIAKILSKENSLLSIQNHISKLIEEDMIYRDEKGELQITNNLRSKK